ncbi:MAG: peptidoglycan DD-metalloendopeptidase family protein [Acidiferrobacterales bacterium]
MRAHLRYAIPLLIFAVLVTACGYRPTTPSSDPRRGERAPGPEYYLVSAGDTLYSITWEAGRNYRDVARWNGIRPPYLLKPGQVIRLSPPASAGAGSGKKKRTVVAGDTLYSIAAESGVDVRDLARWNDVPPPYVIKPGQALRLSPPQPKSASAGSRSRALSSSGTSRSAGQAPVKVDSWVWPTAGPILARFSHEGSNKGLDIGGRRGQTIRAAAPGKVVYKGSGLRGYGQLIIVKHNRDFLSAYAHADRIYVAEGDVIKRGQKIAAMGGSGTDRVKLHFEIRYRGSPVDPLKYLPKR